MRRRILLEFERKSMLIIIHCFYNRILFSRSPAFTSMRKSTASAAAQSSSTFPSQFNLITQITTSTQIDYIVLLVSTPFFENPHPGSRTTSPSLPAAPTLAKHPATNSSSSPTACTLSSSTSTTHRPLSKMRTCL